MANACTSALLKLSPSCGTPASIQLDQVPVYCINIPSHTKRRSLIQAQADQLGIHVTFLDGVMCGTSLSKDVPPNTTHAVRGVTFVVPCNKVLLPKYRLTYGELGCTLAHVRAFYDIVQHTTSTWAVVIEDDVSLAVIPYWKNTLNSIVSSAPSGTDIVRFGASSWKGMPLERNKKDHNGRGTFAYAISVDSARKFIEAHETSPHHFVFRQGATGGVVADFYLYTQMKSHVNMNERIPHTMDASKSIVNPKKMNQFFYRDSCELLLDYVVKRLMPVVVQRLKKGDTKARLYLPGTKAETYVNVDSCELIRACRFAPFLIDIF